MIQTDAETFVSGELLPPERGSGLDGHAAFAGGRQDRVTNGGILRQEDLARRHGNHADPPPLLPQDMRGFTTPAMALFMNLPERGKGVAYIRAMRMAANLFSQNLGGTIQDNHHNIITDEDFDKMEEALAAYDAGKDPSDYDDMPASI